MKFQSGQKPRIRLEVGPRLFVSARYCGVVLNTLSFLFFFLLSRRTRTSIGKFMAEQSVVQGFNLILKFLSHIRYRTPLRAANRFHTVV